MKVRERQNVVDYIISRQLQKPYLKAKAFLEKDQLKIIDFKIRKPKSEGVYYFRINRKYRALGHFIDDIFIIVEISDHQ